MTTGLRRLILTGLLGLLVSLGMILALFGRRPRRAVAGRAAAPVPVAVPPPAGRKGNGTRKAIAAGLAGALLLAGLSGILSANRDALFGPGPHKADGDGRPLAASQPPGAVERDAPPPQANARTGERRPPEPGEAAGSSRRDAAAPAGPNGDIVRVEPNGEAGAASPIDGRSPARRQADDSPAGLRGPASEPTGPQALLDGGDAARRDGPTSEGRSPKVGDDRHDSGAADRTAERQDRRALTRRPDRTGASRADGPATDAATAPRAVGIEAQAGGRRLVTARAEAGAVRRLALSDTLIAPAIVARDGTVTFGIRPGVEPEGHDIRSDLVNPATGTVRARVNVPFPDLRRDDGAEDSAAGRADAGEAAGAAAPARPGTGAAVAGRAPPEGLGQPASTGSLGAQARPAGEAGASEVHIPEIGTALIVPGDSLWKISRRTYGAGDRYTLIYGANQDQIRDPDLIHPGQVLVLPGRTTAAGRDGARDRR